MWHYSRIGRDSLISLISMFFGYVIYFEQFYSIRISIILIFEKIFKIKIERYYVEFLLYIRGCMCVSCMGDRHLSSVNVHMAIAATKTYNG